MRCPSCGFAWVAAGLMRTSSGLSIYEDSTRALFEDFADYYRDASADDAAVTKLNWVGEFVQGGRLLDVGANYGHFISHAVDRFDAIGMEPSPQAVDWARTNLRALIERGSIGDDRSDFAGRFDVITMFDVIEHLESPLVALQQCRRFLAPHGRLFITTPDAGSVMARLLGRAWYHYDLEQHISIFSVANLQRVLEACGFTVIQKRRLTRRYRFSYIDRRLRDLGRESMLFRTAHAVAFPLRLFPQRRIAINLHDVIGVVARLREE